MFTLLKDLRELTQNISRRDLKFLKLLEINIKDNLV